MVLKNSCLEDAEDYDFIADKKEVPSQFQKFIKGIAKIKRLREVKELDDMLILRRGNRLSITPLTKKEYEKNRKNWNIRSRMD